MRKAYVGTVVTEYTVVFVVDSDECHSDDKLEKLTKKYVEDDQADSGCGPEIRSIDIREITSARSLSSRERKFLAPVGVESYAVYGAPPDDVTIGELNEWLRSDE